MTTIKILDRVSFMHFHEIVVEKKSYTVLGVEYWKYIYGWVVCNWAG